MLNVTTCQSIIWFLTQLLIPRAPSNQSNHLSWVIGVESNHLSTPSLSLSNPRYSAPLFTLHTLAGASAERTRSSCLSKRHERVSVIPKLHVPKLASVVGFACHSSSSSLRLCRLRGSAQMALSIPPGDCSRGNSIAFAVIPMSSP